MAVGTAEELVMSHQEYQRALQVFEDWLEEEQEKLSCYTQLEGDVDTLEETLQKLQVENKSLFFPLLFVHFFLLFPFLLFLFLFCIVKANKL